MHARRIVTSSFMLIIEDTNINSIGLLPTTPSFSSSFFLYFLLPLLPLSSSISFFFFAFSCQLNGIDIISFEGFYGCSSDELHGVPR